MKPKHLQSSFYLKAKKSLGQNFLKDHTVIEDIVSSAHSFLNSHRIQKADILEIGPGTGILTKALLEASQRPFDIVTAIEKDPRAIKGLQRTLENEYAKRFILIDNDILKHTPVHYHLCIGNIPYYITSDIFMWICRHKKNFLGVIFMVQDEVADRICAKTNTKEYSRLTVKMQLNFEMKKLFQVPKSCFVPEPKVNSAVIQLIPKSFALGSEEEEKEFESFTAWLFSQRRKMLRRIFLEKLKQKSASQQSSFWKDLRELSIHATDRPESISPPDMLQLYKKSKSSIY